jgi:hypothetical protein
MNLGSISPMRDTPNFDDANFAMRLYELRREPELRKARAMIGDLLDGATAETVDAVRTYGHPENAHFRQVTSYWEIVASFVNRGIFHPDVYLDTCGEGVYVYATLEPHIERIRAGGAVRFLVQTERVIKDNPAIVERLAQVRKMIEAAAASNLAAPPSKKKPARKAKASARR